MAGPTEPIRKRRRPALSCVECRRRKVKCDRNSPCGQCRAHKSTACTYAVAWATGPVRHESQRTQEPLLPEPADQGASEPQQPASSSPNPTIGESTGPGISLVLGGHVRCTPPRPGQHPHSSAESERQLVHHPSSSWPIPRHLVQNEGLWPWPLDELCTSGTPPSYVEDFSS